MRSSMCGWRMRNSMRDVHIALQCRDITPPRGSSNLSLSQNSPVISRWCYGRWMTSSSCEPWKSWNLRILKSVNVDSEYLWMQIFVPSEDHFDGGLGGFLLGWWLGDDGDAVDAVVVASVASSAPEPRPEAKDRKDREPHVPYVLGELLAQGAQPSNTLQRRWITLAKDAKDGTNRCGGPVLRLVGRVPTVELIRYDHSVRTFAGGLQPGRSTLRSALPFLDAAREAQTAEWTKTSRFCLAGLGVLCYWASQIGSCLVKPLAHAVSHLGLQERSACLTHLDGRSHMQTQWAGQLRFLFGQGDVKRKWKESTERDRLLLVFSFLVLCFDAVLGFFVMVLLWFYWPDVLSWLVALGRWAYGKQLAALVPWLMGAPADFKLNRELTSFAGSLFLSIFSLWEIQLPTHMVEALASAAQVFACCCAMMGASFVLTLLMDILAVASLPLFVAYVGTCLCWKMATRSLYSLCLLFQGWKYNILRSRVDHHNFSLDQLLIGVILLSIVVFLLPSLFVFYTCFAAAWLLVICIHAVLGLLVIWCNYQPFALLLLLTVAPYPWHHGLTLTLEMTDPTAVPHAWWRLGVSPPRLVDAMAPLKEAWLAYVQQLLHGAAKAMICGTVWPIRCPLRCSLTLPKAKSLEHL